MSVKKDTQLDDNKLSSRMRRGELFAVACPSRDILKHVTSRWGVLVLIALQEKTYRFSELCRKVNGVSEKMLTQTLQSLTADGFVKRKSYPVIPPKVEYTITPLGREVGEKVEALADWIEENVSVVLNARKNIDK